MSAFQVVYPVGAVRNVHYSDVVGLTTYTPAPANPLQAATHFDLQNNGAEIACTLEESKRQRDALNAAICADVEKKAKLLKQLQSIDEQLKALNENLICKVDARNQYDSTIKQTEEAYSKIADSSAALSSVLKKEAHKMSQLCTGNTYRF